MPSPDANGDSFTTYGWLKCFWIVLSAFQVRTDHHITSTRCNTHRQYGYHISALNQIQAPLTCQDDVATIMVVRPYGLAPCIEMSDVSFSLVTSIFTVGGLLGSAVANLIMDGSGRKGTLRTCAALTAAGAAVMGLSNSVTLLAIGRCATSIVGKMSRG
jgi:Sugar (and other) transporter